MEINASIHRTTQTVIFSNESINGGYNIWMHIYSGLCDIGWVYEKQ